MALPTLWLTSRDEARDGTGVTAVGIAGAPGAIVPAKEGTTIEIGTMSAQPGAQASGDQSAFGEPRPVYLDGPAAGAMPILSVAVPTTNPAASTKGHAAYGRFGSPGRCDSPHAPPQALITVTNVNNGRAVVCRNTFTMTLSGSVVIVLDAETFLQIADLVDSPVPVRLTW